MKISDQGLGPIWKAYQVQQRNGATMRKSEAQSPVTGDKAEISALARELQGALREEEPIRAELVAALRQQVIEGTYQFPIDQLAHRLAMRLRGEE